MNHRRILMSVVLASLMSTAMGMMAQQVLQPPTAETTEAQEPASLEGTVLRRGSTPTAGVARARVVLSSAQRGIASPPAVLTAVTDDDGRFALRGIPPGPYNILANRDGYVQASKPVVLASRDSLTNVVLEMTPTGAISGHIRNRAGEPLSNALVQAQRYTYREGRQALTNVQSARTNDLGEFRLYYLTPGRYLINATPESGPRLQPGPANTTTLISSVIPGAPTVGAPPTGNSEMSELQFVRASAREFLSVGLLPSPLSGAAFVPVYFPGTMDASAATVIDLSPGENFASADFTVSEMRSIRVRGRIMNGVTGQSADKASVILISKDAGGGLLPSRSTGSVTADGTFEFLGVSPGKYDLIALVGTLPAGLSSGGTGYPGGVGINPGPPPQAGGPPLRDFSVDATGIRLAARVPIDVNNADIEDVVVTAQMGYTLRGRVLIEGASLEESQRQVNGVAVQLMPTSGDFESAAMPGIVRPDGSFTIVGALSGTYQIWLMGAANMQPGLSYVKSATLGGLDAINPRLVIDGEPRGELEIVVSTARGFATVSVVDAKQAPAKGATVVFVPDASRRQHFDLYQRGITSPTNGTATMNIPAGDYTAYAFENIEVNSWLDPEVMQKYSGQGAAVRIEPGGKQQLNLKLIPGR